MNVQMLTLAGILAGLGVVPWIHIGKGGGKDDGWFPRFTAWMFGLSAGALTLALPWLRDTLAAYTQGKGGLGVLTVALVFSGLCFWFQAVHRRRTKPKKDKDGNDLPLKPHHKRHHYDRVWTMVVCAVFGTTGVVAWVRSKQVIGEITKSPGTYAKALGQYKQEIHNGTATHAMSMGQVHQNLWLIAGCLLALILLLRGFERRRHGKPFLFREKKDKNSKGGGGRRAVGGGGGQGAIPGGGNYPAIGG
jgi:hypothetical protein